MSDIEDIENRLKRLEKAVAALTETAIETKAYCWAIMSQLPEIPARDADARQKMAFTMGQLMEDAKKDWRREIVQAGGLLPKES